MKIGYGISWLLISIGIIVVCLQNMSETTKHCGEIVRIIDEQSVGGGRRSRGYVERLVLIKFDDLGLKSINLNPESYYTSKIGQNVCVDLNKSELGKQSVFIFILFFVSCLSGVISIGYILTYFIER